MKKALVMSFILLLPAAAFAQLDGGELGVYADQGGADCHLTDPGGLAEVYVVHTDMEGSGTPKASQFQAAVPACLTSGGATYLSDVIPFSVVLGNTQTGVSVGYAVCLTPPILVATIRYFSMANAPTCCEWEIGGHPDLPSGEIEISTCLDQLAFGDAIWGKFGDEPTCGACAVATPTEETTWGNIKSIYVR